MVLNVYTERNVIPYCIATTIGIKADHMSNQKETINTVVLWEEFDYDWRFFIVTSVHMTKFGIFMGVPVVLGIE